MKFHISLNLLAFLTGGAILLTASPFAVQTVIDPTGNNFINLLGINNSGKVVGFDNNPLAQGFTLVATGKLRSREFPGCHFRQW